MRRGKNKTEDCNGHNDRRGKHANHTEGPFPGLVPATRNGDYGGYDHK